MINEAKDSTNNTVDNITDNANQWAMDLPEAIASITFLSLLILCTLIGNTLVILSVFTYKPLKSVPNFYIVSLAVADMAVAIFVLPLNVAHLILEKWIFGLHACKMWLTCDVLLCTASILNLCAIALDRYWAIHDPINYAAKRTVKRVLVSILLVWAISSLISIAPLFGWNDWPDTFDQNTPCELSSEKSYVVFSSSGSFYIPLFIMTIVYIKIFLATRRRLRERRKAASAVLAKTNVQQNNGQGPVAITKLIANSGATNTLMVPFPGACSGLERSCSTEPLDSMLPKKKKPKSTSKLKKKDNDSSSNTVHRFLEEKQRISLSRERRAARTMGIIMGVFILCWLPFFLMYVILPFCGSHCFISKRMMNFITWLGYVNSSLNPVIYTIFNIDFRKGFQRLLTLKCNAP